MGKQDRKLTPAELRRKELFEVKVGKLEQLGYEKKDLTVSVVKANVLAIVVMFPFMAIMGMIYAAVNGSGGFTFDLGTCGLFFAALLILTVIHEGVHGITWAFYAKEHFKDIEFGVIWSMLTPYCTCRAELTKGQYFIGAAMPTIIVGFIPAIIAVIWNIPVLFAIASIMILGGGGDAIIIWKLLMYRSNGKETIFMDHPYECGIVVFEKEK